MESSEERCEERLSSYRKQHQSRSNVSGEDFVVCKLVMTAGESEQDWTTASGVELEIAEVHQKAFRVKEQLNLQGIKSILYYSSYRWDSSILASFFFCVGIKQCTECDAKLWIM